jgi:hypothetical protein
LRFSALKIWAIVLTVPLVKNHILSMLSSAAVTGPIGGCVTSNAKPSSGRLAAAL